MGQPEFCIESTSTKISTTLLKNPPICLKSNPSIACLACVATWVTFIWHLEHPALDHPLPVSRSTLLSCLLGQRERMADLARACNRLFL